MYRKKYINQNIISIFLFCACFQSYQFAFGQAEAETLHWRVGVAVQVGTHIHRVGCFVEAFWHSNQWQLSHQTHLFYHFKSFGTQKKGFEWQSQLGILRVWNGKDTLTEAFPFWHLLQNRTPYHYGIGYAIQGYWNRQKTSQMTGSINFQLADFQIITENDIFGSPASDRFRTANFSVYYQTDLYRWGFHTVLWTGNPMGATIYKGDTGYPSRYGYVNMAEAHYGNTSAGVLAVSVQTYLSNSSQLIGYQVGIDAEQVRHWFQNRLIHDLFFIPPKWNPAKNPHLPMLDTEGKPYLFLPTQKIKKIQPYMQFYFNDRGLY